jgi:ATP phosphoribosyltransferase regulatory subunit
MRNERWLLPEGIDELLPDEARRLEALRRRLLDLHAAWGYELVITPFIEYLDSLLTGTGKDLELQTFKLTDQLSGRMLGVRADITPQAARIDAHQLRRDEPTRLCYLGSVLRTRGEGLAESRSPLQLGAELYGHAGVDSDVEVLCLMMATLRAAGIADIYLDLGHVGIFRGLARDAGLDPDQEAAVFAALQRKAEPEVAALVRAWHLPEAAAARLIALATLNGDDEVPVRARTELAGAPAAVLEAVDYVTAVAAALRRCLPEVPLHYDLAELRGYGFHSGVVFAAFVPGQGQEVARGGRYDHIGEVFGRARPATGFSADLKTMLRVGCFEAAATPGRAFAPGPAVDDIELEHRVEALRDQGWAVVRQLPGQRGDAAAMGCTHRLVDRDGDWVLDAV